MIVFVCDFAQLYITWFERKQMKKDLSQTPCETYMGLRDPSFTDEQWEASVADRRKNLISRKKS